MVALQITEIGVLLNRMLKGDMFDHFLLKEAAVSHAFDTVIDGALRDSFYTDAEREQLGLTGLRYIPWPQVRPIYLDLLKGNRKPSSFRFQFLLAPQNQEKTVAKSGSSFGTGDITGLFLNLIYKNDNLVCTTGISYRTFSPDKSLEQEWDRLAALFLKQHGITVDNL
ncbi:MAG: DUF5721 family protein [Clostridiales bacterium]|nr:DUF5721 family protein [Clostridiales bacterium]